MQIENIGIDTLTPYTRNSRTHDENQVAQIAASIREFGFTNPLLVDGDGGIIAGHGRLMAARKLGMSEVPCIRLPHLTDVQKRAYVIADNKLALNAGWDDEMLALEIDELGELGFDLCLTGFDSAEIESLSIDDLDNGCGEQSVLEQILVMVICRSDLEQREVLEKLINGGHECRALTS